MQLFTTAQAVSLFLDLLYAGTSYAKVKANSLLEAVKLSHRWQVEHVTNMLERSLVAEISDATFVSIAEVTALLDLPTLKDACLQFASTSAYAKRSLKHNQLPPMIAAMVSRKRAITTETDKSSKHRRIF